MRARRFVGKLYDALLWLQVIAGSILIAIGGVQKAPPESISKLGSYWPFGAALASAAQASGWWSLPLLTLATGISGFFRKVVGPPWLWQTVHSYLDTFRDEAFNIGPEDDHHHHRVTLFKHVGWCWHLNKWPWSGWLVPVERSGYTTQTSITIFRAPDDADNAQGIAGRTWARGKLVMVSNLPDLAVETSEDAFKRYAEASGVTVEWLRKRKPRARSFCGIPVEVKGRMWGVLVLDSRSPCGIKEESQLVYRPLGKYLSKILERV